MRFPLGTKQRLGLGGLLVVTVSVVVVSLTAASPALAITPDDCATARSFGYTQTDIEIAADAALVADGILAAVPDDALSTPARVAAVAAWAVPQGVLRGFEHSYNIAQACDDADHQQLVKDNLDVKVSTRATQTSVNSVGDGLAAHATLDLRLQIETDLSQGPASTPIALFELPASQGGYLELTRGIVASVITKMQAAGQTVANAPKFLAQGDALLAAHDYKHAYLFFGKAYRNAASLPDAIPGHE
jgi:hypothetical protein